MQVLSRGQWVTEQLLRGRVGAGHHGVAKWVQFCRFFMRRGYQVSLYEAHHTVSKYVTVHGDDGKKYTARFSNHKPNKRRELKRDCDIFVGVTNYTVNTINDAIRGCLRRLEDAGEGRGSEVRQVAQSQKDKMEEEGVWRAPRQMDLFTEG